MKIEFLYKDDTYKNVIENLKESLGLEENSITYTPVVQAGLNIFSFQKIGENEDTAKLLDGIKTTVLNSLSVEKLFIITDEVSLYFSQRLYPQLANFERGLRKVLYIASMKSNDEDTIELCKKIENLEFAKIYEMLFSDTQYVNEAKKIVNSNSPAYSKHDILKKLSDITETTIWDKLFQGKYSYISENFLDIKDGRNKVMHSRSLSYTEYSTIKNHLSKCNTLFSEIEYELLEKNDYSIYDALNIMVTALRQLGKVVVDLATSQAAKALFKKLGELAIEETQKDKLLGEIDTDFFDVIDDEAEQSENTFIEGEESNGET